MPANVPARPVPSVGRAVAIVVAALLCVAGLPGAPQAFGAPDPQRAALLAAPGTPPGPIPEADRHPVIAVVAENGVRDPDQVTLSFPSAPTAAALAEAIGDAVALPEESGTNFTVFGTGPGETAHLAAVSPGTVNYQAADGSWLSYRNKIESDPTYGWRAVVDGATVWFRSSIGSEAPVRMDLPGGLAILMAPDGVKRSPGKLIDAAVTYTDVLTATDLIYAATQRGYEEQILLRDPSAPDSFTYSVETSGITLNLQPTGEIAAVADGRVTATIPPAVAWDSSATPIYSPASYSLEELGPGRYALHLKLDPAFLSKATYPVTIDPGSSVVQTDASDTYVDSAFPSTDFSSDWLRVADGTPTRRAFVRFDVAGLVRDDRIVYGARMDLWSYEASGSALVDAQRVLDPWPSPLTWANQPSAGQTLDSTTPSGWGPAQWELKELYQHVLQSDISSPWPDYGVRLSTSSGSAYRFSSANVGALIPQLSISYNDLPHAPQLDHPAAGGGVVIENDSPTLKVLGGQDWPNDPNDDEVYVSFQISDSETDFTGNHLIWESTWSDERSVVVPSGILVDGQTYYWRARSWDMCPPYNSPLSVDVMCSLTDGAGVQHEQNASGVRSFQVVLRHLGQDDRWAMSSHDLGNGMQLLSNEANGNVFLDVPLDTLQTAVGPLSIGLSYNSQQQADLGLSPGWDLAIGPGSSARDLPVELVKLGQTPEEFPDAGVKIRLGGGTDVFFPHREKRVFAAIGSDAGIVREDADGTFLYTTADGSTYTFSDAGELIEASPVFAQPASGGNSIDYVYTGGQLTQVRDPLGRTVTLDWGGDAVLDAITSWAGQTFTLGYNLQNGRLNTVTVQVTNGSVTPPQVRDETVAFRYHIGTGFDGGLLREVEDGETYEGEGWSLTYLQDPQGTVRVSTITAPPGGASTTPTPWTFEYQGPYTGTTAAQACITDSLGTPGGTFCEGVHRTLIDFNTAGLPIRIAGPADQTGYWPVTTTIWDSNNNLFCRRSPAANAVDEITGPTNCANDLLSSIYTYSADAPYRLISVQDPGKSDTDLNRLLTSHLYDSDAGGSQYQGLWVEKYGNRDFSGVPADGSVWSNFDADWGAGTPPGVPGMGDDWAMRWSGYLDLTGWSRAREVAFRVTTEDEGVTLVVGNRVLLDCVGTATPPGTFNCGSNQDVSKKLWPGMRPITIEYAELAGDASFRLEWKLDPQSPASQWQVIPASAVRTNLGLLTRTIRDAAFDPEVSRTIYEYTDDDAKTRHLPSAITEKDTATGTERRTEFTYNSYGQTRSVTPAAGTALAATTRYEYLNDSITSCLEQVTVPQNQADQAAQNGAVTTFECDEAGDVTSQTQVIRAVAGTQQLAQTRTTTTEYDSLGRVTKVTTPLGGSTTTLYDAAGRTVEVREYLGTGAGHDAEVVTTNAYDDAGHLLTETLPAVRDPASGQMVNPVISHTWDWLDDEVATTDERGKTWSYAYDALRRLIQTTSPLGLVARTEYRLVSATGVYQHQVTEWSPPGDPGLAGTVTTITSYNVRGWVDSVKVGALTSTTYQYDPLGRRTRETAPSSVKTTYTYDGFDEVTARTDFFQSATPATTTSTYDAAGRLSTLDGPRTDVNDSLTYTYDLAGNLIRTTQNGIVLPNTSTVVSTDALYNDVGEQIQLTQPLTASLTQVRNWVQDPAARTSTFSETRGSTTYTTTSHLEQAGWVSSITDPRGITLSFEHDNLGRQTRRYRSAPSVADDQTFTYDLSGNMLSAGVVATGTIIDMAYDDDGRIWKVYQTSGSPTTTYTYSATTGQLSSLTDPAGTTSFTYRTGDGLIQSLTDPFSGLATYTYDTAGRITKRTLTASGSTTCLKQAYEAGTGRIDYAKFFPNSGCTGTYRARFDLAYDLASNVTSRIEYVLGNPSGSDTTAFTYAYDGANRLLSSTAPSSANNRTYTWDGGGNRTSVRIGSGTPVTMTYDSTGLAVSSSDGVSYTHDELGNLTMIDRAGTTNDRYFTYSSFSQLTKSAKTLNGSDIVYTVDALDRVLSRAEGSSTASYTYSGVGESLAKAQVGSTTTLYANAPEGPLGQKVGTTVRYYLTDLHADLVGWTTTSGTLQGTAAFDPFGGLLSSTGEMATISSQGALRFQSDLTDPTTLQVDMGARYYEPVLGGFSSRDPVAGELTSPVTLNAYGYAGANPVTNWDPTGRKFIGPDGGGGDKGCGRKCQAVLANPPASPAVEEPTQPSISTYAGVMFDEHLPLDQRMAAAERIYLGYGELGRGIVEDWLAAIQLESESSIGYQIIHHPYSSWQEGPIVPKLVGGVLMVIGSAGYGCLKVDACIALAERAYGFFNKGQPPLESTTLAQKLAVDEAASGVGARTIIESDRLRALPGLVERYGGSEWVLRTGPVHWDGGLAFQAHWFEELNTGTQVGWHFRAVAP